MEYQEDDVTEHIDFGSFFDECPEGTDLLTMYGTVSHDPSLGDPLWNPSSSSPDSSWINQLENVLMQQDGNCAISDSAKEFCDTFLADVLVDCGEEGSSEVVDSPVDLVLSASEDDKCHDWNKENDEGDDNVNESGKTCDNDPISKKRRRQQRNREAAFRSREMKKSYVKDLEMKSRYLEGECRRLGGLLQCCYAENQALRHNLHMGFGSVASVAKQESAVLLLESLLLGSLLWFMGVMCLFTLPKISHPNREPVRVESVVEDQEKLCPRVGLSESQDPSFGRSRRCRSGKIKMKPCLLIT